MSNTPTHSTNEAAQPTVQKTLGVSRRTVVKGAAWSVPVIAAAVAAPIAAASLASSLNFTLPTYAGTACTRISNVQAVLTNTSGAPDPGKAITVTLSNGYTFEDGTTVYTGTTDANGKITLPSVRVPAAGGNTSFQATSGTLNVTAPVTAPPVGEAKIYSRATGQISTFTNVPAGSTSLGDTSFLAPNGDLYVGNKLVASGVSSAGTPVLDVSNNQWQGFVSSTGVASIHSRATGQISTFTNVPAGSTSLGDTSFLAPNGDLYVGNKLVASGVSSAGTPVLDVSNNQWQGFVSSTGVASIHSRATGQISTFTNVPAGSTSLGDTSFLAPNGDLYVGNKLAASGVSSAGHPGLDSNNNQWQGFVAPPACTW
ncbi:hypothetical protein RL72_00947 [Microbacterium azadirachtae]|uniref:Big-1 domain-containing protein n=1 Tax=Microbacterium azadirachtae TaxID=582680 RepID=A0A0F0L2K4_9MICO|nr:hypothetical protein RL72_00947 [Microbacterium azadirachtae]